MSAQSRQDDSTRAVTGDLDELDPSTVDQINRNIRLTSDFLQAVFDDPSILDKSPEDSYLILVPEDDPALAEGNPRGGQQIADAGHSVHVYRQRDWKR